MSIAVKICGLNSAPAADAAVRAGAAYGGLVFFPKSPRALTVEAGEALAARMRGRLKLAALVVDPDDGLLERIATDVKPDFFQLHGQESVARAAAIKTRFGIPLIKAFAIGGPDDLARVAAYDEVAEMFLFDTPPAADATRPGGHGVAFDWRMLAGRRFNRPWFLAGGLNPGNVARAITVSGAQMVDVSSGVESAPGVKSEKLIADFVMGRDVAYAGWRNARMTSLPNSFRTGPDASGHFGAYGGRFVAETLMPLILDLEKAYEAAKKDPAFQAELDGLLEHYVGRESPLYFAERLTQHLGGAKIYLKREDLNHTGAHKINNCLGQILLARRMGKTRIIAETGAGQHGVATATVAARFGLPCVIYMGEVDMERQKPNVFRMRLLGAEVRSVSSGSRTLKDATNEALRDWVANVEDTFYIIGSVVGPHPYPQMVRDFQTVIGNETRAQMLATENKLPDLVVACVGGGSNAMGMFHPFADDASVEIHGVEAAGDGVDTPRHAATLSKGTPGVLHGARSYLLQDSDGQILEAHSISAGLDYPGIGPEHSWLKDSGRVKYYSATDREALDAFMLLSKLEGIIPALESAHAIAHVTRIAGQMKPDQVIAVCLSGRGDKDVFSVANALGEKL